VCREGERLESEAARLGLETASLPFHAELCPLSAMKLKSLAGAAERAVIHAHTAHAAGTAALARLLGAPGAVVHRRVDFHLNGGLSRALKYERAGRVVAVSEAIAGILAEDGLSRARVSVVPDAVPADEEEERWAGLPPRTFVPATHEEKAGLRRRLSEEFGLPPQATWIGNLAALVPHKDHDNLIAAAVIVLLQRPDARFLIAGEGPEQERLFAKIKRLGMLGKIVLLGRRDDPLDVLKTLDVFALSSWGEGMGSVLLEASACGLPIAATTAGGIPEVVEDGKTGLLCPPRDPEALAKNLMKLLDDAALRRRLGEAARAALPRFGLKRMAEQMEKIYAELA
jgi:glycosyltransferase involved in cell wall biosynthesis